MAWLEITLIVDGLVDIVTSILRRSGEDFEYDRLTETTNKVVFGGHDGDGGGICSIYFDARLNRRRLAWEKKRRWC